MTSISTEQLQAHRKWLAGCLDGKRLVLRDAVLTGADLQGAYLQGAYLQGAVLQRADLQRADLQCADLRGADLRCAYLRGAVLQRADLQRADLRGADLRCAYLRGAVLQGAYLRGVNLQGAIGLPIAADAQERLRAVATAALQPNALEMETWHTCETTHYMAGWAIHLAGEPGKIMEKMLGPEVTGLLLLGSEAHRYFYKSNEEARQFLQGVIEND